jgi:4,5-dihydroxyphthalate decarboxylase
VSSARTRESGRRAGTLSDDYGFAPEKNRGVLGGLETPLSTPFEFTTHPHPGNVENAFAPPGSTPADVLDRGEIDVLFRANAPTNYLAGSPGIHARHRLVLRLRQRGCAGS